jgi:hypothetical protein
VAATVGEDEHLVGMREIIDIKQGRLRVTSARLKELGEMMIQNFSNNFRNTTNSGIQSWQILN